MKKHLTLIFFCILSLNINAQTANDILAKVNDQVKQFKSAQLDFDYTMLNTSMNINESNKGNLSFKGSKYILNLNQLGISIYCDGTYTYTYNREVNEVTISTLEGGNQMMNPTNLFTMYKEGFTGKYLGETTINGVKCHKLEMTPIAGNDVEFKKAELFVNTSTNFIHQAKMYVDGGTVYTLSLKNLKKDIPLKDANFVFNTKSYPGIEVIDLR